MHGPKMTHVWGSMHGRLWSSTTPCLFAALVAPEEAPPGILNRMAGERENYKQRQHSGDGQGAKRGFCSEMAYNQSQSSRAAELRAVSMDIVPHISDS